MNLCPVCNKPVPDNEWVSYRRHEDCASWRAEPTSINKMIDMGITPDAKHSLGGYNACPDDRRRKISHNTE